MSKYFKNTLLNMIKNKNKNKLYFLKIFMYNLLDNVKGIFDKKLIFKTGGRL